MSVKKELKELSEYLDDPYYTKLGEDTLVVERKSLLVDVYYEDDVYKLDGLNHEGVPFRKEFETKESVKKWFFKA